MYFQYATNNERLQKTGKIYSVEDKYGQPVVVYVSLDDAKAISLVPEMLAMIYDISNDDQSTYQMLAKVLLKMIEQKPR
jgi:hypothetical protein